MIAKITIFAVIFKDARRQIDKHLKKGMAYCQPFREEKD